MKSYVIFVVCLILTIINKDNFISLITGTIACLDFLYLVIIKIDKDSLSALLHKFIISTKMLFMPQRTESAKVQNENICSIEDMYQFRNIPFEWHWVETLNYTNEKAWFQLNKNNQYVALQYIDYINNMITDAKSYIGNIDNLEMCTEEIDFDYPIPMYIDSVTNTHIECTPYTKTGRFSKYPVTLHFASSNLVTLNNGYEYQEHPYMGYIKIMQDGNIGLANILFAKNHTNFSIGLNGISLVIKRVDTDKGNIYRYQ